MKKNIYILAFILLGLELQFLLHGFIEINYINLLENDFNTFSFGFTWAELHVLHHVLSSLFVLAGASFGFWQGKYWWKYIYVDKKLKERWKEKKGLLWKVIKY